MKQNFLRPITVYLLAFLFALHLTPALYINSSFLEGFVSNKTVGYIYTSASILTILSFFAIRPLLIRFGNRKVFMTVILIDLASLLTMAFAQNREIIISAFILSFMMTSLAFFNIDIFIEKIGENNETGKIRGIFLTSLNSAFIIGPLITGLIIGNGMFSHVYILGAILLLPVLFLALKYLGDFKDPHYEKPTFFKTSWQIWKNKDLHNIFSCTFLLWFFFSWMIIYTPIYLHDYVGFNLATVSIIISFALIPFILLEGLLGRIADTILGEKEILTLGFFIAGISTIAMSFIDVPNVFIWGGILFMTRVGASMIEVMTETYLFKKINAKDINTISIYRTIRPVAYIVGPITASLMLLNMDFKYIFLVLGIIVLYGMRHSLSIKDTL